MEEFCPKTIFPKIEITSNDLSQIEATCLLTIANASGGGYTPPGPEMPTAAAAWGVYPPILLYQEGWGTWLCANSVLGRLTAIASVL